MEESLNVRATLGNTEEEDKEQAVDDENEEDEEEEEEHANLVQRRSQRILDQETQSTNESSVHPDNWTPDAETKQRLEAQCSTLLAKRARLDVEKTRLSEALKKINADIKETDADVLPLMQEAMVPELPLPIVHEDGKPRKLVYCRNSSKEPINEEFLERVIEQFLDDPEQRIAQGTSTLTLAKKMTEYVTSHRDTNYNDKLTVKVDNERGKALGIRLRTRSNRGAKKGRSARKRRHSEIN